MYSDCFLFHRQYIYHRHKLILSKEKPPMNYDIIITYIAKNVIKCYCFRCKILNFTLIILKSHHFEQI